MLEAVDIVVDVVVVAVKTLASDRDDLLGLISLLLEAIVVSISIVSIHEQAEEILNTVDLQGNANVSSGAVYMPSINTKQKACTEETLVSFLKARA